MNNLVSVIIPIYNDCRFFSQAITSVLDQTVSNFEIIIIDDCSQNSDEILKIIHSFSFPIRYYRNEKNYGLARSRNIGVNYSKGNFLIFLDADDIIYPKKIEVQLEIINQGDQIDFVFSDEDIILDNVITRKKEILEFTNNDNILLNLIKKSFIPVFTVLVKKSSFLNCLGFDDELRWNEDDDMWVRILVNGEAKFSSYISGARRLHNFNMSKNKPMMIKYQMKSFSKWMKIFTLNNQQENATVLIRRARIMYHTLVKQFNYKTLSKVNLFDYLKIEVLYFVFKLKK